MSYNQPNWLEERGSVTSEMMRPSVESCMRPSVDDSVSFAVITDALHLRIQKLSETNARIKRQIIKFADLNDSQRKEIRTMFTDSMELADDVQKGVQK